MNQAPPSSAQTQSAQSQSAPPSAPPRTEAQRQLWQNLAGYIEAAYALFGSPSAIARQTWFSRAAHKLCAAWLVTLEALLRRLLYLDALELTPTQAPAAAPEVKTRARSLMRTTAGAPFDVDNSETWRTQFLLLPRQERRANRTRRKACAHLINAVSSAPLALRFEAIIRAYNDREAQAQRLADHLHARRAEAPALYKHVTRRPPRALAAQPRFAELLQSGDLCAAHTQAKFAANTS